METVQSGCFYLLVSCSVGGMVPTEDASLNVSGSIDRYFYLCESAYDLVLFVG